MITIKEIIERKKYEVREMIKNRSLASYRDSAEFHKKQFRLRNFQGVITEEPGAKLFNLIAEIKRKSPSAGEIKPDADLRKIAGIFDLLASAITVLTDSAFLGELYHLNIVRQVTTKPILRKDFIIHPAQIYQSRLAGADSLILMAHPLGNSGYNLKTNLTECISIARSIGLEPLVESHTIDELILAEKAGAIIYGINHRDLMTMETSLETTKLLADYAPKELPIVLASGIKTRQDVESLHRNLKYVGCTPAGMLVGEALIRSEDIPAKMLELLGKN